MVVNDEDEWIMGYSEQANLVFSVFTFCTATPAFSSASFHASTRRSAVYRHSAQCPATKIISSSHAKKEQ
jgi:hypothetical protein